MSNASPRFQPWPALLGLLSAGGLLVVGLALADPWGNPVTGLFGQSPGEEHDTLVAVPTTSSSPSSASAAPANGFHAGPMLRRMLDGPLAGTDEVVFAARISGRDHWYVNFGNYACDYGAGPERGFFRDEEGVYWGYGRGARLCRLNLRTGKLTVLLDDPAGGIRDPQVHYDGKKILFSYRKGGVHPYHLYEINTDGTGLRQLTDGPDDDIEPTYLPDGSIIFCSSRCHRFVNCWFTRVATLYKCDADGQNIRMLSSNNDHDNTPWVLPDGRVLYMRWEYVDRSQVHFHHLWTMNPDGTGQMVYFGNEFGGIAMLDAKPIPGTGKVVMSASPGHGQFEHAGAVAVVDPNRGPDVPDAMRALTAGRPGANSWRDPYPIAEDCFLVARGKGLFVMDGQGNAEPFYRLPDGRGGMEVHEPRPVRARPREPVIPPRVDLSKATGRLVLADIHEGRNMAGVGPGQIKKLLVLKQLPKPINFSGGMEPLTIYGTFTLAEIVGDVPVEPDGSAHFDVPALQSLFFVALDENDVAVKRMHSFVTLQPGEMFSCVGCHEQRNQAPHFRPDLAALRRPPSSIRPIDDVPRVFDFTRDIQPILDRHCVECHNADRDEGWVDLSGDKTVRYTMSYWHIRHHRLVNDGRNRPQGNYAPFSYGSAASRLLEYVDGKHHGVKLSDHERKMLRLWIDTSATYPGTYASLGCGDYNVHMPRTAMNARCGPCHAAMVNQGGRMIPDLQFPGGTAGRPGLLCNLSRPEKSRLLRGPLAKEAGGTASCKEVVFADKNDPLYKKLLAAIQDAHRRLEEGKRFDMPGFRPNADYLREMRRFGILPPGGHPDYPIDGYRLDRAYWDSFDYRPAPASGGSDEMP
ncbi:MAG: PD40 domain-containing protein [Pirellulales bacterium]|nr:PD40 domain-containing protein [Pirellulales bacterium]